MTAFTTRTSNLVQAAAVLFALAAMPGNPVFAQGGPPPPLVDLAEVKRESLIQTAPITGRLVAKHRSAVASRISGRISRVLVDVGERVEEGQVLAEIELDRLKLEAELKAAEVIQARAKWQAAQAQVDFLSQELKRLEGLRQSAAFSQARFEDKSQEIVKAKRAVDENAAMLQRARAARDLARIDVDDASIKAPFAGAVIQRNVAPGEYVNNGAHIVTLLNDRNMEIEADVPSDRLSGLSAGAVVEVEIKPGTAIRATVRAVVPDENPLSRTRAVRLLPEFGDESESVVPNQSVVLHIPRGVAREMLSVPKDAIVTRQSGPIVFVYEDGRVRPAAVEIGDSFASKFEILSGLSAGQQVVVRGNELLRPGQPVRTSGGPPGAGGPGGNPAVGAIIQKLSPEERQKFLALSGPEKRAFIEGKLKEQGGG